MRCRNLCPARASQARWRHGLCRSLPLLRLLADLYRPRRMAPARPPASELDAGPGNARSAALLTPGIGQPVARSTADQSDPQPIEATSHTGVEDGRAPGLDGRRRATRAGHAGERRRNIAGARTPAPVRPSNRCSAKTAMASADLSRGKPLSQCRILRISSASTHSARFRFTLRSMLPTARVCKRRPCTLRPDCPPRNVFSCTR